MGYVSSKYLTNEIISKYFHYFDLSIFIAGVLNYSFYCHYFSTSSHTPFKNFTKSSLSDLLQQLDFLSKHRRRSRV